MVIVCGASKNLVRFSVEKREATDPSLRRPNVFKVPGFSDLGVFINPLVLLDKNLVRIKYSLKIC